MDVDAMTVEKHKNAMRKGLCFSCGKAEHLNRDCPDKKKTSYLVCGPMLCTAVQGLL